ncbi:protein kinase [Actinomadura barringtoniae]|uniref:Protein kinase n=1 Tax=Actinomadura barringtoniae TaxID=1427535 RepID=A0A939TF15_9ACTN|nr:ABC transporter substrate-binding protein [Actinomadura barringtoniae]MBO2453910.1 protein kinase [Actinomadura barringtoniae]
MSVLPLRSGDPERLGAYGLVARLGTGGQGTVFLGETTDGVQVAIKQLHAQFNDDPRARARFAAELAAAQRVAPFCTASILDSDVEGDAPYIVSEYVPGLPLSTVVKEEGPRTGPGLDRIAVGTITALAAIHQAGIVHRDFKPANVLLGPDGPRVIDFGVARALDATTVSGPAVGTPSYMAPEQISGDEVGAPADVFAWASTMIYAATGRPPYGKDSIPAVMHRILYLDPDLGGVQGSFSDLLERCLAKEPGERPASQEILMALLDQSGQVRGPNAPATAGAMLNRGALAASTEHADPAPDGVTSAEHEDRTRSIPPRRRRWVLLAGSAAAVLAVSAGGMALAMSSQDDTRRPPAKIGGTLMMMVPSEGGPPEIDPARVEGVAGKSIVRALFTGLVEAGPDGRVQRRLATAITPSDGCRAWDIAVRPGTTFSDGSPVDAAAFVRGWNRAAKDRKGPAAEVMGGIKGFGAARSGRAAAMRGARASGSSIRVELDSPDCEFDQHLADTVFLPVPRTAGPLWGRHPVGNGPFKIASYERGERITLDRNDRWALGRARLDRVVVTTAGETSADGISAFQNGRLGFTPVAPGDEALARSRLGAGDRLLERPAAASAYLVPITARGPLRTREARLAVSYALDRAELTDKAFNGLRSTATSLIPAALPGFGSGGACASCLRQDPAEARRLAAQAGLKPGTRLKLLITRTDVATAWAPLAQRQLKRVLGLKLDIRIKPSTAALTRTMAAPGASGLAAYGHSAGHPSAYAFLHPILGGGQSENYSAWRNADFDAALARVPGAATEAERVGLARAAEKIALDDMALIPLWDTRRTGLVSKRFTGLDLGFDGAPTLATASLR